MDTCLIGRRLALSALITLLTALCLQPAVAAQSFTGKIAGMVSDQSGAILPGVSITVTNTATNATREILTYETGSYVIPALPAGNYVVMAEFPGFSTQTRTGVVLQVNQTARVDFQMQVGEKPRRSTSSAAPRSCKRRRPLSARSSTGTRSTTFR